MDQSYIVTIKKYQFLFRSFFVEARSGVRAQFKKLTDAAPGIGDMIQSGVFHFTRALLKVNIFYCFAQ